MLARRRLGLSEFDFDITCRANIKIRAPNALSRPETGGKNYADIKNGIPVTVVNFNEERSEANTALLHSISPICDKKIELVTLNPEVQTYAQQVDPKGDSPPTWAESITAQAQDLTY